MLSGALTTSVMLCRTRVAQTNCGSRVTTASSADIDAVKTAKAGATTIAPVRRKVRAIRWWVRMASSGRWRSPLARRPRSAIPANSP